jgi:hypothetical protein
LSLVCHLLVLTEEYVLDEDDEVVSGVLSDDVVLEDDADDNSNGVLSKAAQQLTHREFISRPPVL